MLTDEELDAVAEEFVRTAYPSGWTIRSRETRSDPEGIFFVASPDGGSYGGPGGFFVTRASGEVWAFGSSQTRGDRLDYWLKLYADGWRFGTYRVTVTAVEDPAAFAELLRDVRVSYRFREVDQGAVWIKTVVAQLGEILDRLATLPCTFLLPVQELVAILSILEERKMACVDHDYIGVLPSYDWRPENNTPDQLGRQWDLKPPFPTLDPVDLKLAVAAQLGFLAGPPSP